MNPLIQLKTTPPLLITLALLCFSLLPRAEAVVPPPDGGYPNFNTAEGQNALFSLTTGSANTAVGWYSLKSDTVGSFNTAVGAGTLLLNTADQNTAVGAAALLLNTDGEFNTAVGVTALLNNTDGDANTAIGHSALFSNTTGFRNTANGDSALLSNTTGSGNTATGFQALHDNTTGDGNTANGEGALTHNTEGNANTAVGITALFNNTTGSGNIALGLGAGFNVTTANNVICIRSDGANLNNTCFIGNIRGVTTANADAIPVVIDSAGQLGTMSSSRRFKNEIKPMDCASEAIHALKPVTFHYKSDASGTPQFGLIAEEVAEVNPNLVVRDEKGDIYTVRYDAVNAMLLNEFLKEHRRNEEQEATIVRLIATDTRQQTQIEALTAAFQKVSAQIEASKPALQVVNNP